MDLISIEKFVSCEIIRRINRFVVLVRRADFEEPVHINNTGRLEDVLVPGARGFCIPLKRPRKLRLRLFGVWYHKGFSVIDTNLQETAFEVAVKLGAIPWLEGCNIKARSPRIGGMRLDFIFECNGVEVLVETKSAVLEKHGMALYPDCPSQRGRKHIEYLIQVAREGRRALLLFIAAFPGAKGFMPNREGDPVIPKLVEKAIMAGVSVRSIGIAFNPTRGTVYMYNPDLPVILSLSDLGLGDAYG